MASSTSVPDLSLNTSSASPAVAVFITKVWNILESDKYKQYISWSESGKNVIVHDYPSFSKNILPHYFKHSNFNSFVRQLNLYGFRKVAHPEQGVLSKVQVSEPIEFWHPNFKRGHPELLHLVQRRPVNSRMVSEEKGPELSKVVSDIHQMKGKQENIGDMLEAMRQDNVHLKRELQLLKERHSRQQRVLNKIIQFLIHMVYKGRLPSGSRRRPDSNYLMLTDSVPPAKRGRVAMEPPSPPYTFTDTLFTDVTKLPIEAAPTVEPIPSVPPLLPTVTTPPSPPNTTSLIDIANTRHFLEPVMATSSSFVSSDYSTPQLTTPLPPSSSSSPPIISTSSLSPASSTALIPAVPDTKATPTDGTSLSPDYTSPAVVQDWTNVTEHLDSYQQELDSLPDFLSNQLCMDPTVLNQFLNYGGNPPVPDYDAMDTARLLEALSQEGDGHFAVVEERSPGNALVPIAPIPYTEQPSTAQPEKSEGDQETSPGELLELFKDTLTES